HPHGAMWMRSRLQTLTRPGPKKERPRFRGLPHHIMPLSERLRVTEVHGTAIGVVQVEVPRTAVERHQFRITIADVGRAKSDLRIPRSVPGELEVVGRVTAHLQGRRDG